MVAAFSNSGILYIGVGLLLLSIGLVLLGTGAVLRSRRTVARRLEVSPSALSADVGTHQITLEDGLLQRFEKFVTPKDATQLAGIRKRLVRAGYRKPSAVRVYFASRAVGSLALLAVAVMLTPLVAGQLPVPGIVLAVFLPALLGFFLPTLWVERQIERRREEAELAFPDALDMILVCIEAGNGIDQAFRRVSREMTGTRNVLSEEFGVIIDELWAGKDRGQVFEDFTDRVNVPDINAFATVLKQSDEFGVSIAETLRVYAAEMRNKRVMRAEEKANLMPVKLAMGSIAFTVPPTMLVMAGPSLIMMLRSFATH